METRANNQGESTLKNRAPAFQFYAAEYLADEKVQLMSLEEEGAYIRLLAYCWREGSLPAEGESLAKLCKGCSADVVTVVARLFQPAPNNPKRLIHKRLEEEREKQKNYREQQCKAGKKSAEVRSNKQKAQHLLEPPLLRPLEQTLNGNSSLQSSSSTSTSKLAGETDRKTESEDEPSALKTNCAEPRSTQAGAVPDVVHEIFQHFPTKAHPEKSLEAIQGALKVAPAQVLLASVKAYAAEVKRTNTHSPTWATVWFAKEMWKSYLPVVAEFDEPSTPVENDQDFSSHDKEFYEKLK